jgi:hypothetical protein
MIQSKTAARKKAKKTNDKTAESVAVPKQQTKRKVQTATRRIPVQYTPRIPTARCPWC